MLINFPTLRPIDDHSANCQPLRQVPEHLMAVLLADQREPQVETDGTVFALILVWLLMVPGFLRTIGHFGPGNGQSGIHGSSEVNQNIVDSGRLRALGRLDLGSTQDLIDKVVEICQPVSVCRRRE
jgi:hypothetical protein